MSTVLPSSVLCPILYALGCNPLWKLRANSEESLVPSGCRKHWLNHQALDLQQRNQVEIVSCCHLSFFSRHFSTHMKVLWRRWRFCSNNNRVILKDLAQQFYLVTALWDLLGRELFSSVWCWRWRSRNTSWISSTFWWLRERSRLLFSFHFSFSAHTPRAYRVNKKHWFPVFVQMDAFWNNPHQWKQKLPCKGAVEDDCKTKRKRRNLLIHRMWLCTLSKSHCNFHVTFTQQIYSGRGTQGQWVTYHEARPYNMSNQLLETIHFSPVLHCNWCKNSRSQKGEHFPSDLEGLERNEERVAHLPAQKWLTDTGTQPFCKIMLADTVTY